MSQTQTRPQKCGAPRSPETFSRAPSPPKAAYQPNPDVDQRRLPLHATQPSDKTNGTMSANTNAKKRSGRACESCRSRKVRCDMQTFGSPCTNCLLNEAVCQPGANTRKLQRATFVRETCTINGKQTRPRSGRMQPNGESHDETIRHRKSNQAAGLVDDDVESLEKVPLFLPPFVEAPRLPRDDLEYLHRKGCMSVPEWGLMTELLTSYCNWVHPQLPVIDLKPVLEAIFGPKTDKISLLLLQAVLYSGAAFVEESILLVHGYSSKIEAQDQLFQRAKLLYQAEYENDALALAQAALLLSINHRSSKSSTIWLAHSHNVAERLGLQYMISYVSMDSATASTCKRLWWCIFVRDCILNLELGTPKLFRNRPDDTPQLTAECFAKHDFSTNVQSALLHAEIVHDPDMRLEVAWIAVKRAQLAALLCPIQALTTIDSQMMAPRSKAALGYLDRGLQSWATDFENQTNRDTESFVSDYHQGLLLINYFATRITLLQRCPQARTSNVMFETGQEEIGRFINRALRIVRRLYSRGGIFCATSGMSTVFNIISLAISQEHQNETLMLEDIAVCLHALQNTCPRGSVIEFALCSIRDRLDKMTPQDLISQHDSTESESLSESSIRTPFDVHGSSAQSEPFAMQENVSSHGFEEYFEMLIDPDGGKFQHVEM